MSELSISLAVGPLADEDVFPVRDLPDRLPQGPAGPLHMSTIWRWVNRGIRGGVKLEAFWLGGQRMTSTQAVERFLAKLNE